MAALPILSSVEIRVLGALSEKEMTTPEYYPMTVNAVRVACNQKSNRHPVVEYSDEEVLSALDGLRAKDLAKVVVQTGSRTKKYIHRFREALHLNRQEQAVITLLCLRGPQTIGELRGRSERMVTFEDLGETLRVVEDLAAAGRIPAPLVTFLERVPGQKEQRVLHLLAGDVEEAAAYYPETQPSVSPGAAPEESGELRQRIEDLEERVARLEAILKELGG
ncbi:MAG TPA: YceH family protein [Calditrichia bacterium]|nr:YceH family protein [Calditrichota bacterium]HQV32781.1 YceH family protein [Calditrichia bacterium]